MRVPVRLFATRRMLEDVMKDKSLEQAVNAATLPGLVGHVIVMPDMHQGYGFPIGGVAATRLARWRDLTRRALGTISTVVFACSVPRSAMRLPAPILTTSPPLSTTSAPAVSARAARCILSEAELIAVCRQGSRWALKQGFATEADLRRTEESGCVEGADPDKVSVRARQRGRPQLGSLGAGNHFIEIDLVEQVFDPAGCFSHGS